MFILAAIIGIYSYLVFGLGVSGLLYPQYIFWLTVEFLLLVTIFSWSKIKNTRFKYQFTAKDKLLILLLVLIAGVNLIGALGPEIGFDALWYHLTIPKIWLEWHKIDFIADGRYYYSVMPKLVDILYIPALALGNEIVAKLIHWGFGVLAAIVTFRLARIWLSKTWSLLSVLIFYSNLVVGWQSTTAYIDLGRTFFEVLALYLFVNKSFVQSALTLGLAAATKLLASGSLPIYWVMFLLQKANRSKAILFTCLALLVPLPWIVFAGIKTGNPIYPILSGYDMSSIRHINDLLALFIRSADPLNPIYLLILPGIYMLRRKLPRELLVYCLSSLVVWFIIPRTGGGRFILPYLPAWSVLAVLIVASVKDRFIKILLVTTVLVISLISLGYRGAANYKYVPFLTGHMTKEEFLNNHLPKGFGEHNYYLPDPLQ